MQLTRREWIGLVVLTLCWGISWPVMKIGVSHAPPLIFRSISFILSVPVIFVALRMNGYSPSVPAGTFKKLILLAIPNVLFSNGAIILGVHMLPPGRAAILCYTMPVWAAIATAIVMKSRPSGRAIFGVCCAAAGALLMLSGEFSNLGGNPLGVAVILFGAANWGLGTVLLRNTPMNVPPMTITFWMVVISSIGFSVAAVSSEWHLLPLVYSHELLFAIIYNGVLVSAIAQVIWISLARNLPPVASSMSVMLVPVLGIFSSTFLVGEMPALNDYAAMVLILIAMASVLVFSPRKN